MRVNNLRSKRNQADAFMHEKGKEVGNAQNKLSDTQQDSIRKEELHLSKMIGPPSVNVGTLVEFIKVQQRGVLELIEAKKDIEAAQELFIDAKKTLNNAELELKASEKKLIGIEEVIKLKLWN